MYLIQVEAYDDHVGIVTSDYEAFVWGTFGRKRIKFKDLKI